MTRWWIVEAKYSPWNVAKGFYSKVQIGSKRHQEMVQQMRRLLTIANETGKKGVMVVTTTDKSIRNLRRLYNADADLAKAIKGGQIVFKKINWWGR